MEIAQSKSRRWSYNLYDCTDFVTKILLRKTVLNILIHFHWAVLDGQLLCATSYLPAFKNAVAGWIGFFCRIHCGNHSRDLAIPSIPLSYTNSYCGRNRNFKRFFTHFLGRSISNTWIDFVVTMSWNRKIILSWWVVQYLWWYHRDSDPLLNIGDQFEEFLEWKCRFFRFGGNNYLSWDFIQLN